MKLFAIAVFGLAFSTLLLSALGKVNHLELEIMEKGTIFKEEVDVDAQRKTEVFRVPGHNDVEGADFYNDFKKRLTVSRVHSRRVCYVSQMESSLPSPGKLKADIKRAASQPGQLRVITKRNLLTVKEPANRRFLTKEILEFCGAWPIYNTEITKLNSPQGSNEESTNHTLAPVRVRRQNTFRVVNFTICNKFKSMEKVQKCMEADWDLNCRMKSGTCYYYVSCKKIKVRLDWECEQKHITYTIPACCEYICP